MTGRMNGGRSVFVKVRVLLFKPLHKDHQQFFQEDRHHMETAVEPIPLDTQLQPHDLPSQSHGNDAAPPLDIHTHITPPSPMLIHHDQQDPPGNDEEPHGSEDPSPSQGVLEAVNPHGGEAPLDQTHIKGVAEAQPSKSTAAGAASGSKGHLTKCWNSLCFNTKVKKTKSKINGRGIFLCPVCIKHYNNGQFCEHCEQIYGNEMADGEEWVECQTKGCGHWNHTRCERKHNNFDSNCPYYCTECRRYRVRSRNKETLKSDYAVSENKSVRGFEDNPSHLVKVFKSQREVFGHLESMLSSFGYHLFLPTDTLNNDALFNPNSRDQLDVNRDLFDLPTKKRRFR